MSKENVTLEDYDNLPDEEKDIYLYGRAVRNEFKSLKERITDLEGKVQGL